MKNSKSRSCQPQSMLRFFLTAIPLAVGTMSGAALAQTALGGSDLILPAAAAPNADMVLLKTQANGSLDSFDIVVANTGPVQVTGATVTDKAGNGGLCPKGNSVTITGNGIPEGRFKISDLSGPGIVLGTLRPGQSATISYSCQAK